MDVNIAPECPADSGAATAPQPRSWHCSRYVSVPAAIVAFAAVIGGMHCVVRPAAGHFLEAPAIVAGRCP